MRKALLGIVSVVALISVACSVGRTVSPVPRKIPVPAPRHHAAIGPPGSIVPPGGRQATLAAAGLALAPFSTCDELLAYVKNEAYAQVTPYGLPWPYPWMGRYGNGRVTFGVDRLAGPAVQAMGAASSAAPAGTTGTYSTTTNQEAAVDELDSTKTDGRVLVTLGNGPSGEMLQVVDVHGSPRLAGKLALPGWGNGLFLVGNDVVVIGQSSPLPQWANGRPSGRPKTQVSVVSIADPDRPVIVGTFGVDGNEVAARLVGQSVKLVVSSGPTVAFTGPTDDTPAAAASAMAANRLAIASSTLDQWLPSMTDGSGNRHAVDCGLVNRADRPQGLDTVSVVSFTPDRTDSAQAVTVLADAQTVYSSPTALYVAALNLPPVVNGTATALTPSSQRTVIHAFHIVEPTRATYAGSGEVPGVLLNQYSMSEWGGDLRVASTLGTPAPPPGEGGPVAPGTSGADQPGQSESLVTVLRFEGATLARVGQAGGLGRGQKIFGVRFLGALGYVVTFRQLDPLYVLDLSDPRHPLVRGALELPGYSAYLLPVDADHLLGVGGSADANGHRTGLQVTMFDVHDPSRPTKVAQTTVAGGYSTAEQDPHALLWWAPASLAVLPVTSYEPGGQTFSGAIGLRIDTSHGDVTEVGRITRGPLVTGGCPLGDPSGGGPVAHPPCASQAFGFPITRDLVVGSRLYSVSNDGVIVSDVSTFQPTAWFAFS